MCNVTHFLLVIGTETPFEKMCNDTYKLLLVIRKDIMRLSFTTCAMSLTVCWSQVKMCLSQNVEHHSLPISHMNWCDVTAFHRMCNVTYLLLVIGRGVMRMCSQNLQNYSLPVGNRKVCDQTVLQKMHNVTDILLVVGKDVIRLLGACATSLTPCWP